ncbi:unnamed protein product, partial [Darwinula stevensoni]
MNDAKTTQQKTGKDERLYTRMLEHLRFQHGIAAPQSVTTDLEKAAQNALERVFPGPRYENDPEFRLQMKPLPALSFVPPAKVEDAFNDLVATMPNAALPVLSYFEDSYIGRVMRGNRRIPPLFEPGLWNNYNRVLQDLPRTSAVEGFHS